MKSRTALMLFLLAAGAAAEPIRSDWRQVCSVADGRLLELDTAEGELVTGYCVSIDVNQIGLQKSDGTVVRVARTALTRIRVYTPPRRQTWALGKGMRSGLRVGFRALLSPLAPVGIVVVPGTLAWGAVSAPFCLIGDVKGWAEGHREIQVN